MMVASSNVCNCFSSEDWRGVTTGEGGWGGGKRGLINSVIKMGRIRRG